MTPTVRTLASANDEFQLLRALLTNRTKRQRQGRFLIHGVRSINAAVEARWPLRSILVSDQATSRWALELPKRAGVADVVRMPAPLLDELSQREDGTEVVAVGETRSIEVGHLAAASARPVVVVEGVQSPGNLGTILRSVEALGGAGVVVTGHAADPYDPQCVRASTGALFTVPFARAASVAEAGDALMGRIVGLHPAGAVLDDVDLRGEVVFVAGTEATGLSRKALDRCDALAAIPMAGGTGSLNVGVAVAIALAEWGRRCRQSPYQLGAREAPSHPDGISPPA